MDLLILFGVRILEVLFAIGVVGSVVVLVLTTIEDIETLTESDEPNHTQA